MFTWTPERIRSLSPDDATWERARRLAHPPVWRFPAGNEEVVWGECKGSGGLFYQTAVDLHGPAFRCSCPVKRQPCKHALSLLLLLHNYSDVFRVTHEAPEWVSRWRSARLQKQAAKEDSPEKQALREKNRDKRLDAMAAGLHELEVWLYDLLRQGIATAESQAPEFWEQIAARMVDAKLGSIARRLRLLAYPAAGKVRHEQILEETSELYLLIEGFRRLDQLPEGMAQDLLTAAGLAQRKDDLEGQSAVADRWQVFGVEEGSEEQLRFRRVWLAGQAQHRFALLLDFAWGDTGYAEQWPLGSVHEGRVVFYPSAYPLRAVAQPMAVTSAPFAIFPGFSHLHDAARAYAQAVALNPWLPQMPALLEGVTPVYQSPDFLLVDRNGSACPLHVDEDAGFRLLAESGGHPMRMFGEWNAGVFRILSLPDEWTLIE